MANHSAYSDLTAAMLRTGVLGFGGGPSVMPLFRYEAVSRYHWVTDEEFAEILAFANVLPGPIATKMAGYLGYRLKGTLGAIVAIIAHILPSSIAMIALFAFLNVFKNSRFVSGMIRGVSPVIVAMLAVMAYEFANKARKGLGLGLAIGFGLIAFVLLAVLHLNAGLVVLFFLAYGTIHLHVAKRLKRIRWDGKEGSA
jgi:chromate transporter